MTRRTNLANDSAYDQTFQLLRALLDGMRIVAASMGAAVEVNGELATDPDMSAAVEKTARAALGRSTT
jgi:hypothetical protein